MKPFLPHEPPLPSAWECLGRATVISAAYALWGLVCVAIWVRQFTGAQLLAGSTFFVGCLLVEFMRAQRRARETGRVFPIL